MEPIDLGEYIRIYHKDLPGVELKRLLNELNREIHNATRDIKIIEEEIVRRNETKNVK